MKREKRSRQAHLDPSYVGVTFVGFLFAVVAARILEEFTKGSLYLPRALHLGVVTTLIVTSWIGYHNSWNRPRYFIKFFNLPFWQFAIDILLVSIYWFAVTSVEPATSNASFASADPEARLIALSFGLYLLWDLASWRIRASDKYPRRTKTRDSKARRGVTGAFFVVAASTALLLAWCPTIADGRIVLLDIWLIVLLIAYRVFKDLFDQGEPEHEDDADPQVEGRPLRPTATKESTSRRSSATGQERSVRLLEALYSVVVALALTKALEALLEGEAATVTVRWDFLPTFLVFLATVIPFYHGALRHLEETYIEKGGKNVLDGSLLGDFVILFIEGCILFVLGASIGNIQLFGWSLLALLSVDILWAVLAYFVFVEGTKAWAELNWARINGVAFVGLLSVLLASNSLGPRFGVKGEDMMTSLVMIIAGTRSIADYWLSWNFYFPK